jgi:Tfp pilus assembly protein PilE
MKLIDLLSVGAIVAILAFLAGYWEGTHRDMISSEKRASFVKSVYAHNDRWCEKHKEYCK